MHVWDIVTAASHSVIVFAALLLAFEVASAGAIPGALERIGRALTTLNAFFWVVSALVVERAYYIAARALQHRGIDLWEWHPAPDILSLGLAVSLYVAWACVAASVRGKARDAGFYIAGIGIVLAGLWIALVVLGVQAL